MRESGLRWPRRSSAQQCGHHVSGDGCRLSVLSWSTGAGAGTRRAEGSRLIRPLASRCPSRALRRSGAGVATGRTGPAGTGCRTRSAAGFGTDRAVGSTTPLGAGRDRSNRAGGQKQGDEDTTHPPGSSAGSGTRTGPPAGSRGCTPGVVPVRWTRHTSGEFFPPMRQSRWCRIRAPFGCGYAALL